MDFIMQDIWTQVKNKIDNWCFSNWCTLLNFKKFKIKVITTWSPEYIVNWDFITCKLNETYELYPARWRNAKKIISRLKL